MRLTALFSILPLVCLFAQTAASEPTANEIIDRWIKTQEAKSELIFVRMQRTVKGAEPKEHRLLAVYQRREEGEMDYFFRLVSPEDVEGVTVLVKDDGKGDPQQFLYLPTAGKTRRLTGNARQQPFLSSDFTYDDLQREVPATQTYERLPDGKVRGVLLHRVRARDKDKTAGGPYSHRDLYIDQTTHRLHQVDFFGTDGKLLKMMTAHEYDSPAITGATKRPRRLAMANMATGSSTEFLVVESRLDETFDATLFTPERLEKWKLAEVEDFIFTMGMTVKLR